MKYKRSVKIFYYYYYLQPEVYCIPFTNLFFYILLPHLVYKYAFSISSLFLDFSSLCVSSNSKYFQSIINIYQCSLKRTYM